MKWELCKILEEYILTGSQPTYGRNAMNILQEVLSNGKKKSYDHALVNAN